MGQKPAEGVCIYGAGVLLKHLHALDAESEGVRQAEDIEYLHRMRVASRRLRSAMGLFEGCLPAAKKANWTKAIQKVTHALGVARDLDVQIALVESFYKKTGDPDCRYGLRRLRLRLSQQRSKQQVKVLTALDELNASQITAKMERRFSPLAALQDVVYLYPPALYKLSFEANTALIDQLLSSAGSVVEHPEDKEALHAMRIAAKKTRYSLETFAPLYENELKESLAVLRKLQDSLGEIHDCDVWLAYLPEFIEKEGQRTEAYFGHRRPMKRIVPGINWFIQERQETRTQSFGEFVNDWNGLIDQDRWGGLRRQLQIPAGLNIKGVQSSPTDAN